MKRMNEKMERGAEQIKRMLIERAGIGATSTWEGIYEGSHPSTNPLMAAAPPGLAPVGPIHGRRGDEKLRGLASKRKSSARALLLHPQCTKKDS